MKHKPIAEYGLIGNLETCSLVGSDGSIDWCPFPQLDSSSVFAALLDPAVGGHFAVRPTDEYESSQSYLPHTNVLRTTFDTASGSVTLTDFMPVLGDERTGISPIRAIFRHVECISGEVELDVEFVPRFDYGRAETTLELVDGAIVAQGNDERLSLSGTTEFAIDEETNSGGASIGLTAGQGTILCLQYGPYDAVELTSYETMLERTTGYWQGWADQCSYSSSYQVGDSDEDVVMRSALTLKLLTHWSTGAIAAAPTASLPEEVGGVRNWDYRFSWIRDGALTIQAFANIGRYQEADAFFEWFRKLCHKDPAELQPLYGLHGEPGSGEQVLEHFSGYRESTPVRIGNAARNQLQLDIYGELVLAIHEATDGGAEFDGEEWPVLRDLIDHVCDVWDRPDDGIWEVRSEPKQFVFSKVMCWVALDRGIDFVERRGFDAPVAEWRACRTEIERTVLEHGYNETLGSFTRTLDGDSLDATGLLLPILGFLPADDDRIQGTIDATLDRLVSDSGLVDRYNGADGLQGEEGTFTLCSFWLVNALILSGRVAEGRDLFETLLTHMSPLGLLAEEIDPETSEFLGNFPQAFSHIGLINSALYLDSAVADGESNTEFAVLDKTMNAEGSAATPSYGPHEAMAKVNRKNDPA